MCGWGRATRFLKSCSELLIINEARASDQREGVDTYGSRCLRDNRCVAMGRMFPKAGESIASGLTRQSVFIGDDGSNTTTGIKCTIRNDS